MQRCWKQKQIGQGGGQAGGQGGGAGRCSGRGFLCLVAAADGEEGVGCHRLCQVSRLKMLSVLILVPIAREGSDVKPNKSSFLYEQNHKLLFCRSASNQQNHQHHEKIVKFRNAKVATSTWLSHFLSLRLNFHFLRRRLDFSGKSSILPNPGVPDHLLNNHKIIKSLITNHCIATRFPKKKQRLRFFQRMLQLKELKKSRNLTTSQKSPKISEESEISSFDENRIMRSAVPRLFKVNIGNGS